MKMGIIDAEINDMWSVAHDSGELTSAVTSYDITGLEGDTDCEYQLISRVVGNGANGQITLSFNSDTTASNYGYQIIYGTSTTAAAARVTSGIPPILSCQTGYVSFSNTHIFAKSGKERTGISGKADQVNGTSVYLVGKDAFSWNNTSDEMTSMTMTHGVASGLGIGSRFILLKKVHNDAMKTGVITPNKIEGAWERIYSNTLTSAATTVTISGLEGNTDVLYRLIVRGIAGYNGATNYAIRPNNDTGSNYGRQYLRGQNTAVAASRTTGADRAYIGSTSLVNNLSLMDTLLYAKSGYERVALTEDNDDIATTTINAILINGYSWNNTADEITSLVIAADQANGLGIGTNIELYRLNL